LFGSCARGTAVKGLSDVDVFVVVEDRAVTPTAREIAERVSGYELSVLVHDRGSLAELREDDWSFVSHLACESVPVFGRTDRLAESLRVKTPVATVMREEIGGHMVLVEQLSQPAILGGNHLVSYARLFAAFKSVSILDGICADEVTFDRRKAIEGVARRWPDLYEECRLLAELEPFWLRLRRRTSVEVPWIPRGDEALLRERVAAAGRVFKALAHPR
jgi:hypothetical protein